MNIVIKVTVALICLLTVSCGSNIDKNTAKYKLSNIKSTILGGAKVEGDEYNYVVAIAHADRGVFCSGSLINGTTVLTSAHCLKNKKTEDLTVYYGNGEPKGYFLGQWEVKEAISHPSYSITAPAHDDTNPDLAILKLNDNLDDYYDINYPELVLDAKKMKSLTAKGAAAIHVGFGRRLTDKSHTDYKFKVGEKYKVTTQINDDKSFPESIGTGGNSKGAYNGDSGSPLIVEVSNKHYAVGVAKNASREGHTVSIKTSYGADFIKKHM